MWEKLVDAIKEFRLPSLVLIFILLYFGSDLVKASKDFNTTSIAGCVILIIAILFALFFFFNWMNKEHYEKIINSYNDALNNITKSFKLREQKDQEQTTRDIKNIRSDYETFDSESTQT